MKTTMIALLMFLGGCAVGPVLFEFLENVIAPMQSVRLPTSLAICLDRPGKCEVVGEIHSGTIVLLDRKGFVRMDIHSPPGLLVGSDDAGAVSGVEFRFSPVLPE